MTQRISALGSVSFGWLHQEGAFVFDEPFFLDPQLRCAREQAVHAFVAQRFPHDPIYNIEAHLVQPEGRQRPVVLVGGLQPNLILAAALGAAFVFYGDKDPDVSRTPLASLERLDRLAEIDWSGSWPISLFLDQIGALRESLPADYAVLPPFFWDTTGRATTHGLVTTAQKLVGDRLFLEMADRSSFADELFAWIADSYVRLIELFARAAELRVTGLHTGDCSLCMVSPDLFARCVLPHVNRLAQRLGPIRLHSCGHSDHLLELFGDVDRLDSLNVGAGTSVARIRERLGSLRIDLIPELRLLTEGTPAEMDAWVRRCVEENGDAALQFQYHLDTGQQEAVCLALHRTLASLGWGETRQTIY